MVTYTFPQNLMSFILSKQAITVICHWKSGMNSLTELVLWLPSYPGTAISNIGKKRQLTHSAYVEARQSAVGAPSLVSPYRRAWLEEVQRRSTPLKALTAPASSNTGQALELFPSHSPPPASQVCNYSPQPLPLFFLFLAADWPKEGKQGHCRGKWTEEAVLMGCRCTGERKGTCWSQARLELVGRGLQKRVGGDL